jgi:hypothetical protein
VQVIKSNNTPLAVRNVPPRSRCLANQISRESEIASKRLGRENERWLNEFVYCCWQMTQTIALAIIYLFIQRGPSRAVLTYSVAHRRYERGVCCVCVYVRARVSICMYECACSVTLVQRERVRAHYVIRSHNAEPTIK